MDSNADSDRLLYRRQFVLGDRSVTDLLPGWKSIRFGSVTFTVHPDLETTTAKGGAGEFLLLGFVLSHRRPEASNRDLLEEMAGTCGDLDMVLEYCRDLCGRYVIAFALPKKTGLVSDLIGARSVYYCTHEDAIWCASQPSTLARLLGIGEDRSPEVQAFLAREIMFVYGEACWIGDGTKYAGIKHLLPNHYLDLEAMRAFRYWPARPSGTIDVESAAQSCAAMLQATMRAAADRFDLCMAVTAGWDSRCMLAATRPVQSKIDYYIQEFGAMTDDHRDVRIPRKLAQKLGFPFRVVQCRDYQDTAFDAALEKNVFMLQCPAKKALHRSFYQGFQGKVNASGNGSEIARTYLQSVHGVDTVRDMAHLLELQGLSRCEYAATSIKPWYAEAKPLCGALGYSLLDLFVWEQRIGNWGSMFPAELDIAIDEFYPFATRRLIETMLAVDGRRRRIDNSSVHRRMIELLWPELLSEPINPVKWRVRAVPWLRKKGRRSVRGALVRLGLLPLARALRSGLRGR